MKCELALVLTTLYAGSTIPALDYISPNDDVIKIL